jgi:dTDP-4-dehydrorhamnose 3,5-epimerase
MKFELTPINGVVLVHLERRGDERGFFARTFCANEFQEAGLAPEVVQANSSWSARRGTLRGMHYQLAPYAEAKTIRCIRGAIFDVALDLRPDSPTFGRWYGVRLDAENRDMLHVPRGCAHGLLTLEDDTEVLYLVDNFYAPTHERGVRFDDPRFGIEWPLAPQEMSDKDRSWPDFDPAWHLEGAAE